MSVSCDELIRDPTTVARMQPGEFLFFAEELPSLPGESQVTVVRVVPRVWWHRYRSLWMPHRCRIELPEHLKETVEGKWVSFRPLAEVVDEMLQLGFVRGAAELLLGLTGVQIPSKSFFWKKNPYIKLDPRLLLGDLEKMRGLAVSMVGGAFEPDRIDEERERVEAWFEAIRGYLEQDLV